MTYKEYQKRVADYEKALKLFQIRLDRVGAEIESTRAYLNKHFPEDNKGGKNQ